jgi:hypothetical protein
MKKWFIALVLAGFFLGSLPAATVSFLIIEKGLSAESARPESSFYWESGMMDAFFDAGHIVSNAPIIRIKDKQADSALPREARRELDEARLGGADFFVVVTLDYHNNPAEKPGEIRLSVYRVSTGQLLYETSCGGYVGARAEEEFQAVKKSAGKILPQIRTKG